KQSLSVCFDRNRYQASTDDPSQYEQAVGDAAQREYSAEKTGISLSGFQPCAESDGTDVAFIFYDDIELGARGVASTIGRDPTSDDSDVNVKLSLAHIATALQAGNSTVPMKDAVVEVSLHELGHIL